MKNKHITHFGFQNVNTDQKKSMVNDVFHKIAEKYDLMNDLMSFGIHRIWKQILIYHSEVYTGHTVLDLAGGTGDLSIKFSKLVGNTGIVVLADINYSMLQFGRKKIQNLGVPNNIIYIQTDAEILPFPNNIFDCVSVAFGLRNFTNKEQALLSIYRVLKPGGKLLILDFSMPTSKFLHKIYDIYSFKMIPKIGKIITKHPNSYRYLVESIRMHPDQETLKNMISHVGFNKVRYINITGGIVALHTAYKRN